MTYDTADAPSPIISAGLRPYRSETRPQSGALSNCAAENAEVMRASTVALAPRLLA
jgi:hypothetical protein